MAMPVTPLLKVVIHEPDWIPGLMALCAGYELGSWRQKQLVEEVFSWLPSFALPWAEQQASIGSDVTVNLLRKAAQAVYQTDKYGARGEFGELILHGVLRQEFGTEPAVSKLWFKDSVNMTVKGFDVVHISESDGLHLWLGEAKFYGSQSQAISAAIESVSGHLSAEYLRSEFMLVSSKVDPSAPYARQLLKLLDKNTSLDEIFSVLHLPILVTYDSETVARYDSHGPQYLDSLTSEASVAWTRLNAAFPSPPIAIDLILIPLLKKADLLSEMHARLKVWQQL